ncbi:hypothetical protein H9K76_14005 [Diaphorobacter ruginosibacter]|uniref:Uncharacterized protein n=1 Tax=Diaphorobacter ruginosibacter TaxID=1715720 RepID=A0A7G9RJG0_9BURK|nr:hypothetical protein [Diaphorobacter ruginosibacter]QNN55735.1 hypothetical protein H9K76_14005 [Diaphorobacter ruginosibacter]
MKITGITGACTIHKAAAPIAVTFLGLFALGGAQAATLTCGTPLRVSTSSAAGWSTDAKLVANSTVTATVVDNFRLTTLIPWFDPATQSPALPSKWLSFGMGTATDPATGSTYPVVNVTGNADAWVSGRATIYANEPVNVASNVNLSTIRITGTGGADNGAQFLVKPSTLPGGVVNTAWVKTTQMLSTWSSPAAIDLSGGNLGFYYGDNTIGFALTSEATTASAPTGVYADLEITADCLAEPAPQPTTALSCPAGNQAGDAVRIGPFTTNARDWKWTWRNNAGTLENVEQPLYDSYRYRSYFDPSTLAEPTTARWISPGTTDPAGADTPGVPYPSATGQAKAGYHASVFQMNQPITVGSNVDLASIKLDGRFGFDDYGNTVFVQPVGGTPVFDNSGLYLPNGYASFSTATTPAIPGFQRGQNTIGLMLDGGQNTNDCNGGLCALAAIADFYVTATCTGEDPIPPSNQTITFPAQTSPRSLAGGVFALSPAATASSTLPVAYTSLTPDVCTVSGVTVTPVAVGECQIAADQAGGTVGTTVYNAAPRVVQSVTLQNAPVVSSATPVPTLGLAGLSLLGLLSAGVGGMALRRRQRS